jgi:hypothetical protein
MRPWTPFVMVQSCRARTRCSRSIVCRTRNSMRARPGRVRSAWDGRRDARAEAQDVGVAGAPLTPFRRAGYAWAIHREADCATKEPSTGNDKVIWILVILLTHSVRATFMNQGHRVSAALSFDESGALTDFVSHDRFRTTDGKTYTLLRWSTPIHAWAEFDGRRLPVEAEAVWHDPAGEFAYGRLQVVAANHNVTG